MLQSGNCSSVNKSKADSDYVSVNEQSTERGRGEGAEEGKFQKLPGRKSEDARRGADRVDETER